MRRVRSKARKVKRYAILLLVVAFISGCTNKSDKPQVAKKEDVELSEWHTESSAAENSVQQDMYPDDVALPDPVNGSAISVTFIDVGQGDSILIQDNGSTMLIDTGDYDHYDDLTAEFDRKGVEKVDVLVCTHPDADHIGSAGNIISYYDVDTVYMPEFDKDSTAYGYLMNAVEEFDVPVVHPYAGDLINFGTATYEVVGPVQGAVYEDANSNSIIIRMINGTDSFLFTGDATGEETDDMIETGMDVRADVYKAAHHGSANDGCNSETFLGAVNPKYTVISCGYLNDYGHPHVETMAFLKLIGCKLYRTDLQGSITCVSYGNGSYEWNTNPTDDYRNGNSFK